MDIKAGKKEFDQGLLPQVTSKSAVARPASSEPAPASLDKTQETEPARVRPPLPSNPLQQAMTQPGGRIGAGAPAPAARHQVATQYVGENEPCADKPTFLTAAQEADTRGNDLREESDYAGAIKAYSEALLQLAEVPGVAEPSPHYGVPWHFDALNQKALALHHMARAFAGQAETDDNKAFAEQLRVEAHKHQEHAANLFNEAAHRAAARAFPTTLTALWYNLACARSCLGDVYGAIQALEEHLVAAMNNLLGKPGDSVFIDELQGTKEFMRADADLESVAKSCRALHDYESILGHMLDNPLFTKPVVGPDTESPARVAAYNNYIKELLSAQKYTGV